MRSMFPARWLSVRRFTVAAAAVVATAAGLSACSSQLHRAPVEDRPLGGRTAAPFTAPPSSAGGSTASSAAGADVGRAAAARFADNAGKPGYYTVKQGDTLLRVALETGQNWRDIQRWNNLDNSHVLQVGEILRVMPLNQDPGVAVSRGISSSGSSQNSDFPAPQSRAPEPDTSSSRVPVSPPTFSTPAPVPVAPPAAAATGAAVGAAAVGSGVAAGSDEDLGWIWPTSGAVIAGFDEARTKGMLIS